MIIGHTHSASQSVTRRTDRPRRRKRGRDDDDEATEGKEEKGFQSIDLRVDRNRIHTKLVVLADDDDDSDKGIRRLPLNGGKKGAICYSFDFFGNNNRMYVRTYAHSRAQ